MKEKLPELGKIHQFLWEKYGKTFVKKAQNVYYQMSTVKDALVAAKAGGVTAMHDATEDGALGGLFEIAGYSRVGMHIHLDEVVLQDEAKKTCACFGIDPFWMKFEEYLKKGRKDGKTTH